MKKLELSGPLGRGFFVLLDDEDYEEMSVWSWNISWKGYAIRTERAGGKRTIYLHREVAKRAGIKIGSKQVDHRDGDKMDCRRENLRIASNQQNQANVSRQTNNTTGFKGVSYHKVKKKWIARIGVRYKRISLGHFDNPEDAHAAYEAAAIKYFGQFAKA